MDKVEPDYSNAIEIEGVEQETKPAVIEKPATLNALLMALTEADNALEEIDLDQQIDLLESGKVKVDSYKYVIDKLEQQERYLFEREKEYAAAKKQVQNAQKRIKEHLVFVLQNNGFEKFTGHEYTVSLRKARPSVIIKADANASLKMKFRDLIETKYEWKKSAVYDLLSKGENPDLEEFASIKESVHARFAVNKERDKE